MSVMLWVWAASWAAEPSFASLEAAGWAEVATRDTDVGSVRVEHRRVGEIDCLQGIVSTKTPVAKLHEVVLDVPSSPKWSHVALVISDVLATSGDTVEFVQMLDVPNWTMVADRYWVLRGQTIRGANGTVRFRWNRLDAAKAHPKAVEKALAYSSSAVEPPVNWGEWVFTPGASGTEVRYRACSDVGGRLPQGIQKWVASRTLPDTVADMVREAGRR